MEYKRAKDGTWYVDSRINGQRCHVRGKTKKELTEKVNAWLADQAGKAELAEAGPMFADVAEEWFAERSPSWEYGTLRSFRPARDKCIDYFKNARMGQITAEDVAEFCGWLKQRGFAGSTISTTKSVLSLIFDYWRFERKWAGKKGNPVLGYRLPKGLPRTYRKPPTEEQIAAVHSHPDGYSYIAAVFEYTGLRLNEANALQWADIDWATKTISVTKTVEWKNGRAVIKPRAKTKNGIRTVPLLDPLAAILKPLKGPGQNYILSGDISPLTMHQYERRWATYCHHIGFADHVEKFDKNGKHTRWIYKPKFTAHQFRHLYASMLYDSGVGELEFAAMIGHADVQFSHKVYTELRKQKLAAAAKQLNAFVTQELPTEPQNDARP